MVIKNSSSCISPTFNNTEFAKNIRSHPKQAPAPLAAVDNDRDFALREVDSGRYNHAFNEVNLYPILKDLFLNKLQAHNQRLFQVVFYCNHKY